MIFKMLMIYNKAKKGVADPKGLIAEETVDLLFGAAILPGIILGAVTILLGILSFTNWIAASSVVAQVFFWIFIVVLVVYLLFVFIMRKLVSGVVKKAINKVSKKSEDFRTQIYHEDISNIS